MRILQVVEATGAGVGRHVRGLCQDLIDRDYQLTVAYGSRRMDEQFRQFVAKHQNVVSFVPLRIGRKISPLSDLRAFTQLLRLIKLEGPFDVVHGHSSKGGAIARIAGRWSGVPTVYTPHSLIMSSPEISKVGAAVYTAIERILGYWATSKIIAVSEDEYNFILKLRLVPDDRVVLIRNAIDNEDVEYFSTKVTYEEMSKVPLTFGSTMRFTAQKAPNDLIEAFIHVCTTLPQIPMRLLIAGDGELLSDAKRLAGSSGLGEKISFLGWRSDIKAVLQQFDVLVISSIYEAGLSYTIMEAMAAKLPVISTNVFGVQGTLSHVPGNIVVPVKNPKALAGAMEQMATLTSLKSLRQSLRKIGQANHDYVRAHFVQSNTTSRTLEVYKELC